MNYSKLAERLKKLRTDRGMSQAKMATMFGVTQQSYAKWENRLSEPDVETLIKLSIFFEVTTDYLLGASNDIIPNDYAAARDKKAIG
jgi:transcriptional regulator with XRE-family HTH domain